MRPRHESMGVHNRCQLVQIRDPGAILLTPERCAETLCKRRLLPTLPTRGAEGSWRGPACHGISVDKAHHLPLLRGGAYMPDPSEREQYYDWLRGRRKSPSMVL